MTLTVSSGGDSASQTGDITVYDQPPDVSAGTGQTVFVGATVSFSGEVSDAGGEEDIDTIQWDFDFNGTDFNADAGADDDRTPSHVYNTPGIYLVALQATDLGGNTTQDVTFVVVKAESGMIVNPGVFQQVETGDTVSFSGSYEYPAGSVSSENIAWDMNYDGENFDADESGSLSPTHVFEEAGIYDVALRVTAADETYEIAIVTIEVTDADPGYEGPTASIDDDMTVTKGDTVEFTGDYNDPDGTVASQDIAWDFDYDGEEFNADDTGDLTPSHIFTLGGIYQVAMQVTDNHGMTSLAVLEVTVENVELEVDAGDDLTVTIGDTAVFSGSYTDPLNSGSSVVVAWDFNYDGENFNPTQADNLTARHTFTSAGTYIVALQVTNSDGDTGHGDVGDIVLPDGDETYGPSTIWVRARGTLDSIAAGTNTRATDLAFASLTGSITGLDSIGSISTDGWLD